MAKLHDFHWCIFTHVVRWNSVPYTASLKDLTCPVGYITSTRNNNADKETEKRCTNWFDVAEQWCYVTINHSHNYTVIIFLIIGDPLPQNGPKVAWANTNHIQRSELRYMCPPSTAGLPYTCLFVCLFVCLFDCLISPWCEQTSK